jgi:hypothetical protein
MMTRTSTHCKRSCTKSSVYILLHQKYPFHLTVTNEQNCFSYSHGSTNIWPSDVRLAFGLTGNRNPCTMSCAAYLISLPTSTLLIPSRLFFDWIVESFDARRIGCHILLEKRWTGDECIFFSIQIHTAKIDSNKNIRKKYLIHMTSARSCNMNIHTTQDIYYSLVIHLSLFKSFD